MRNLLLSFGRPQGERAINIFQILGVPSNSRKNATYPSNERRLERILCHSGRYARMTNNKNSHSAINQPGGIRSPREKPLTNAPWKAHHWWWSVGKLRVLFITTGWGDESAKWGERRHNGMVAKFFLLARREKPLSHNRIKNASRSRSHRNLQKTTLYRFSASGSASSRECRVNSSFLCKCCHLVDTIKSHWKMLIFGKQMGFLSFFT